MAVKSWKRAQVIGTRAHLIETAARMFGGRGYARTPLEEVVQRAGLTRGAVYHHFKDKRALFEAVVDHVLWNLVNAVEKRAVKRALARGGERESDAIELLVEELCDSSTRRILSVDGPAVLGHERWSELMEARLLDPVRRVVERGAESGEVPGDLAAGLTHLLFGAVQQAALQIGRKYRGAASHARSSRTEVERALHWLLERLLGARE